MMGLMALLIRLVALLAGLIVIDLALHALPAGSGDANIGLGVLLLAAFSGAGGLWGLFDGLRMRMPRLAAIWLAVTAAFGLLTPFISAAFDAVANDPDTFGSGAPSAGELIGSALFSLVTIGGPALLGGLITSSSRPRTPSPTA